MEDIRYQFDDQFPRSVIDVNDFRSTLRGLAQMDFIPLKPVAKRIMDEMEYSSDSAAQALYAGTGVTITSEGSIVQEGDFSLKAVTDGTSDREFERAHVLDLSPYASLKVWERSSQTSDTIQFFVEDSGGNQSYWDITTNGSANTWQQDELDLTSPDGDSGTPADLTDIVIYGFRLLTASTTYYFDTIQAEVADVVTVLGTDLGDYYRNVSFQRQPLQVATQASPVITPPITDPRIDILTIDKDGTLAWVQGTEATTPSAPWSSVPDNVIPICEVFLRTTMTKVLAYEDKDSDTNESYILADCRPFLTLSPERLKGSDVASATTITLGPEKFFTVTGTTTITSITAKSAGSEAILLFSGVLTLTDGSNLKLNGNLVTAANTIIHLISDGTNWHEISRSANG